MSAYEQLQLQLQLQLLEVNRGDFADALQHSSIRVGIRLLPDHVHEPPAL